MREALRGGWADNKGHWKCVLHSFTPPLKQAAMHSAPDHVIERQRRTTENTPTPPGTLSPLNGRTPFPHPPPRTAITCGGRVSEERRSRWC